MSVVPRNTGPYAAPTVFERTLDLSRINLYAVAYVGLVLLSIVAHLWGLGKMAMHHDESIHAWMSWRFYAGIGTFNCAGGRVASSYCYDPVFHGPSLYVLTLISYLLFGDGEAQARLPQAVAGVLMVASSWMLRPYLGKRGALIAGVLLAFAPSLLYYTRFARHDGLMILWTFWIVIGLFRYLDTGQARYLYLLAASVALAVATHELYYILFFLFGAFVFMRLFAEQLSRRTFAIGLAVLFVIAALIQIPQVPLSSPIKGVVLIGMTVVGLSLLLIRVWDTAPIMTQRIARLWHEERPTLWTALGILAAVYVVLYSVFFTDPRGIIDGLYQGLAYWLGSQHQYARGDQPWYYYLMLLPLYEPLALFGGLGTAIYLFTRPTAHERCVTVDQQSADNAMEEAAAEDQLLDGTQQSADGTEEREIGEQVRGNEFALHVLPPLTAQALFPLFLVFWFLSALVAFSWAGEKMPWLLTHIALPGNLLIAWGLGRVLSALNWRALPDRRAWLIPPALLLLLVALGVTLWRLWSPADGQQGQANLLQGLIPLAVVGTLIFSILSIGQRAGTRVTLALSALTVAGLIGTYMIRAAWMVVYEHPDTPVEPLIYTQSSPDVPFVVKDIRTLAINQTRNSRSEKDPVGGLTMPVIMDSGDTNGEGSLAWPYQWYLRDFQRLESHNADYFRAPDANTFQVAVDPDQPDGEKEYAPVVMIYKPHITEATRQKLQEQYVKRYDTKLNWWFPEGSKCDPQGPGYKRFYYSRETINLARADKECNNQDLVAEQFSSVFAPLLWPFQRDHWPDTWRYLIYRKLPEPLRLNGREMEVWVRKDLAPGGSTDTAATSTVAKLAAQRVIGAAEPAQLREPRGVAVDAQGNVYVADTGNHRIQVFGPDGQLVRSIGTFGSGEGQFNEPRGLAFDAQGNLYVADTWNARIVKLSPEGNFLKAWGEGKQAFGDGGQRITQTDRTAAGNAAEPMGFFGPRSVAVDRQGHVYIADTGNRRIVVTDTEGNYQYQWGYEGEEPGLFKEPASVAADDQGNVYVADVWNGRVQVFGRGQDGKVNTTPIVTWPIDGWEINSYDDPAIAAGQGGQVFVSVPSRNYLLYANLRGDVLLRWGGSGSDFASVLQPSGLAAGPDGTVYVVDRGNNRVLQFRMPGGGPGQPGQS